VLPEVGLDCPRRIFVGSGLQKRDQRSSDVSTFVTHKASKLLLYSFARTKETVIIEIGFPDARFNLPMSVPMKVKELLIVRNYQKGEMHNPRSAAF